MNGSARLFFRDLFSVLFGSQAGGTGYPFVQAPSPATFLVALVIISVVLTAVRASESRLKRSEWRIVGGWLLLAFAAQILLRTLPPFSMREALESPAVNGYYTVSQRHGTWELLRHFDELRTTFPPHAVTNLPGKTLLFDALSLVTGSTQGQGYLIMLIANAGSVLLYLLAKSWFGQATTALYALVLGLFLPAQLYFFPMLNTVSPVPLLLVLWLAMRYLASKRAVDGVLTGLGLYVLTIFEPLPLVALPMLAAPIAWGLANRDVTRRDLLIGAGWTVTGFLAVFLLLAAMGFNLFRALAFTIRIAGDFNVDSGRPYSVWVIHNLKDFFVNMGLAQSLIFMVWTASLFRRWTRRPRDADAPRDVMLTAAFLVILFGLDLMGINRGETVRLWIFLGLLMQLFVAHACASWSRFKLFAPVIAFSILQTAVCLTAVGWVIP